MQVTGEPYDPTPCASENSNRGASGPYGAVQVAQPGDVYQVDGEITMLLAKNGNNWTFARGWRGTLGAHAAGATLTGYCSAILSSNASALFWDFENDPHGHNANGQTLTFDFPSHGQVDRGTFNRGVHQISVNEWCMWMYSGGCYSIFDDSSTIPEKYLTFAEDRVQNFFLWFAGKRANTGQMLIQSHITYSQVSDGSWALDEPTVNFAEPETGEWTRIAGTLWQKNKTNLDRKYLPTRAHCGEHPLGDISGPGSAITGNAPDQYKYCVANAGGECYAGSAANDVFINCPNVTMTHCNANAQDDTNYNILQDLCAYNASPGHDQVTQFGVTGYTVDRNGWWWRALSRHMGRYRRIFSNANAHILPDGSWVLMYTRWMDGVRGEWIAGKLPPFPEQQSVNRATFVPVNVQLKSVPAATDNVVIEFGYNPSFYCTSRQEVCVATGSSINEAAPFYWASESFNGLACAAGCSAAIPALPLQVVYYRIKYRTSAGGVIATGPTQVAVSP